MKLMLIMLLLASNCFAQLRIGIKQSVRSNIHEGIYTVHQLHYTNVVLSNLYLLQCTTTLSNWGSSYLYLQVVDSRRTNHMPFYARDVNVKQLNFYRLLQVTNINTSTYWRKYTVYYDHATSSDGVYAPWWTLFYDQFGNWLPGCEP